MRKMKKIMIMFCFVVLIVCAFASCFNRVEAAVISIKDNFDGTITNAGTSETSIKTITSTILTAIRYIGSGVALIMLTYAFIRYMISAASERAEIKKNLIPFVVGAVVLFAASNIVTILQEVAKQAFTAS